MHGRNLFINVKNKKEASFESWSWAFVCLSTLHFNAIIFAGEDHDLIGAISKPSAWPSLKFYSCNALSMLNDFQDWKVQLQSHHQFKGAKLIADSVLSGDRFQSYISVGFPSWLAHLFS